MLLTGAAATRRQVRQGLSVSTPITTPLLLSPKICPKWTAKSDKSLLALLRLQTREFRSSSSSSSPSTFALQAKLPRLPIPSLTATLEQYAASVEPLLQQASPEVREEHQRALDEFIRGQAQVDDAAAELGSGAEDILSAEETSPAHLLNERLIDYGKQQEVCRSEIGRGRV